MALTVIIIIVAADDDDIIITTTSVIIISLRDRGRKSFILELSTVLKNKKKLYFISFFYHLQIYLKN